MNARLIQKNRPHDEAAAQKAYAAEVERRIRLRYTIGEELALLRQRDEKPEEFAAYNAYAEECKRIAREKFGM